MKNYEKMKKSELIKIIKEFERKEKEESAIAKLLRLFNIGIWQFNIKENKSIFDDGGCCLLGINPVTFKGTQEEFFSAVHPEDHEKIKLALKNTIKNNVPYNAEYRAIWTDGTIQYITARGQLLHDDKGNPEKISAIIWDISEQKKSEGRLKESEEKLRAIFNIANMGISITDKNARYVIFNKWWTDNLGYDSEEMKCLTNIDITHPEDREKSRIYFQKIIKGEVDRYRIEKRFIRKDNSIFWGDLSVSAIKDKNNNISLVVGMVIDITERKKLENDIIKSEKKYRQIIELADEGIWVIDTEEKTTFVNPKMAKMFGYEEKEMIGKHIFTFMDKTEAELCKEKVKRRKNGITEQHERIYLKKNGEKIHTHISTSPITNGNP